VGVIFSFLGGRHFSDSIANTCEAKQKKQAIGWRSKWSSYYKYVGDGEGYFLKWQQNCCKSFASEMKNVLAL